MFAGVLIVASDVQVERHLPTMTVEETLRFAFDSMAGGTHLPHLDGEGLSLNDEQKDLVAWMDAKHFKVTEAQFNLSLRTVNNLL